VAVTGFTGWRVPVVRQCAKKRSQVVEHYGIAPAGVIHVRLMR
jgi:hypothetical protein